jgi:hypothetical protein
MKKHQEEVPYQRLAYLEPEHPVSKLIDTYSCELCGSKFGWLYALDIPVCPACRLAAEKKRAGVKVETAA